MDTLAEAEALVAVERQDELNMTTPIHKQPTAWYIVKIVLAIFVAMVIANLLPANLDNIWVVWSFLGLISFPITDPNLPLWKYFMYSPIIGLYEVFDRIHIKYFT